MFIAQWRKIRDQNCAI